MKKRTRSALIGIATTAAVGGLLIGSDSRPSEAARSQPRSCLTEAARNLLSRIEQKFGPMQIVSTCRPGARIAGTGRISRHASGNAIDFNAGAQKGEVVKWLIANHNQGGTMTYRGMSHVHVDIGRRFVSLASSSHAGGKQWPRRMALGGPRDADD